MKNSIKAIFAMLAILPCALFFTACGGEKISTEDAQAAFAAATATTGSYDSDFKLEINGKFVAYTAFTEKDKDEKIELKATIKKSGKATGTDGVPDIKDVKASLAAEIKVDGSKEATKLNAVAGTIGDELVLVNDTKNKTYMSADAYSDIFAEDIAGLIQAAMTLMPSGDEDIMIGLDAFDFESETMKLTAEKTGDKDYSLKFKGYHIFEYGVKLSGEVTIEIKDNKFSKITVNLDVLTSATDEAAKDPDNYKTKAMHLEGSVKISYDKQSITLPSSLEGYTDVTPAAPAK